MRKLILCVCLLALFPLNPIKSNDLFKYFPSYHDLTRQRSQFYALPFLVNPAMVGSVSQSGQPTASFSLNQRYQLGFLNSSNSIHMAYDQYIPQIRGGIGLMATHNYNPSLLHTHTAVNAMYSYVIPVTETFTLRTGIQASIGKRNLDLSEFPSPNHMLHITTNKIIYSNFSAGMMGYSKRFFAGISIHNLNEPDVSFYNIPWMRENDRGLLRRYSLQSGLEIPLGKKEAGFTLSPNVMIFYQKTFTFPDIHIGTYFNKGIWTSGVWYSSQYDALMILLGIQKGQFRVAYSFDSSIPSLNIQNKAHELTVSFDVFYGSNSGQKRGNGLCRMPIPAF